MFIRGRGQFDPNSPPPPPPTDGGNFLPMNDRRRRMVANGDEGGGGESSAPRYRPRLGGGFSPGEGRITQRPTGDLRDAAFWRGNIINSFLDFGYYPTESEVAELTPTSAGEGGYERGRSAVATYVNMKKAELERQANDPIKELQKKQEEKALLLEAQVNGLYGQLQDSIKEAPQLFGSLTPDQIQTYLGPLQASFKKQQSELQGIMAQRGLAASSTEAGALAETGQRFQENVFAAGLDVGLRQKVEKSQAIQRRIDSLFGLQGQAEGLAAGAAAQRSQQDLGQSNLIASLPFFLNQAAAQERALLEAKGKGGSPMDIAMGTISGAIPGILLGGQVGGLPGAISGGVIGGSSGGYNASRSGSSSAEAYQGMNALLLAERLRRPRTGGGSPSDSLFQSPGTYPKGTGSENLS